MDLFALNVNSGEMLPPNRFQFKDCDSWQYILANQLAIPSFNREEIQQMSQALWAERAVDYQCLARWQRYSHFWRLRAICCKAGSCALCRQEFHDPTLPHKSTQKWCTCNFPKPSGFRWVRQRIRKRRVIEVSMRCCFAWHKPRNGNWASQAFQHVLIFFHIKRSWQHAVSWLLLWLLQGLTLDPFHIFPGL